MKLVCIPPCMLERSIPDVRSNLRQKLSGLSVPSRNYHVESHSSENFSHPDWLPTRGVQRGITTWKRDFAWYCNRAAATEQQIKTNKKQWPFNHKETDIALITSWLVQCHFFGVKFNVEFPCQVITFSIKSFHKIYFYKFLNVFEKYKQFSKYLGKPTHILFCFKNKPKI